MTTLEKKDDRLCSDVDEDGKMNNMMMMGDDSAQHALFHVSCRRFSGNGDVRRWLRQLEVCGSKDGWSDRRQMLIAKRALTGVAAMVARCEDFNSYTDLKKILIDEFGGVVDGYYVDESERCGFYNDESEYSEDDMSECCVSSEDVDVDGCLHEEPEVSTTVQLESEIELDEESKESMNVELEKQLKDENIPRSHNQDVEIETENNYVMMTDDINDKIDKTLTTNVDDRSDSDEEVTIRKAQRSSNMLSTMLVDIDTKDYSSNKTTNNMRSWIDDYNVGMTLRITRRRGRQKVKKTPAASRWRGVKFKESAVENKILKDFKKRKKF